MQIAALLHERRARVRLQAAVGAEHWVAFARGWGELDRCLRALPVALAIIDPRRRGRIEVDAVERLTVRYPSLSVVVYSSFGPDVAGALLGWARRGVHEVAFLDLGDSPLFLHEVVRRSVARSIAEGVATALVDALAPLGEPVREALRLATRRLAEIRSASDWASGLRMPARTLHRLFRAESLPAPRRTLDWLRLLYVAKMLDDPGCTLEDVRQRLRFAVPRGFWRRAPELAGAPLTELRYTTPFAELVDRFAREARVGARGRPAVASAEESTG